MGCASSAALPFLTNRGNQAVSDSPRMNGNPPYELKMVNNKLKENGMENGNVNVKDVNEAFVTEKMKELVESPTLEGVVGGVVQGKDEVVAQVQGFGDVVSENVTLVVDGVQESIESAFGKLTDAVGSAEEKLNSEISSMGDSIKTVLSPGEDKMREMQAEVIDELLESLPTEEEVTGAAKATAEDVLEKAVDEAKEEGN